MASRAAIEELAADVASLLGIQYAFVDSGGNEIAAWGDVPPPDHVKRWLRTAQRELVAVLPADAVSELWVDVTAPAGGVVDGFPGARVVSVRVGGVEARQVPFSASRQALDTGSLFSGSAASPKWWVSPSEDTPDEPPVIQWAPAVSGADVVFLRMPMPDEEPDEGDRIHLARHLWPVLVARAHLLARQADEDDAAVQVATADYQRQLAMIMGTQTARHDASDPGAPD